MSPGFGSSDSTPHSNSGNTAREISNRGVQAAQGAIDWVAFTYPVEISHEYAMRHFDGPGGWVAVGGQHGYRKALRRGDVWVLYDGATNMGVHVQVTGNGCRQLEEEGLVSEWPVFLAEVLAEGASFTRIDAALDDRTGSLSLARVWRCVKAGLVVSLFDTAERTEQRKLSDGEVAGETVRFGSSKSDVKLVIYDKAAKEDATGPWTRVEFQAHRKRARAVALELATKGPQSIPGLILSYVDFKRRGRHQQRERWPSQRWWARFLGTCEKVRLSAGGRSRDPLNVKWLWRMAPRALARMKASYGTAAIESLVAYGEEQLGWVPSSAPACEGDPLSE